VDAIDNHIKSGNTSLESIGPIFKGVVVSNLTGNKTSDIYYIKMSTPSNIVEQISNTNEDNGQDLSEKLAISGKDGNCDRDIAFDIDYLNWYEYVVNSYYTYSQNAWWGRKLWNGYFPQYTTKDQSYYLDQSNAFIGLGYIEGLRLRSILNQELEQSASANNI
jgi:hypothetical protein